MSTNQAVRPFGLRDKIGYALGDFGNNFTFLFASMYLMTFCTNVLGMNPAIVGIILSASKIVDAFTDFGMGRICDTAKPTKDGRFRPWIKRMAIPMGLSSILIYQFWVSGFPMGGRVAWVAIFYIVWGSFFYTACNIPYGSMASVITNDSKERTQLSSWRTIGATMSGMLIGIIAPTLIFATSETGQQYVVPEKFTIAAIVFGIISAVCYLGCYALTTERVKIDPAKAASAKASQPKLSIVDTLKGLVTCGPLLVYIVVSILILIASLGLTALQTYLYMDYFNNTSIMSLASMLSTVAMIAMAPIAPFLASKIGKKEVGCIGLLISGGVFLLCWVMHITNPMVYVILRTVQSMGLGLNSMVAWAFISDIIDYQEVKAGVRTDGTVYSTYSFTRKIAQAAAAGLGGFLLTAIGYVQSTAGEVVVQTEAVKSGIYTCMNLLPAVLTLVAVLIMWFLYPLGKKQVDENTRILAERRAEK
ncbi:MAG: glycoside-pentoside-hexuronide (GPH):cation symporter [Blautia sp.]|nr:glycoside-pentoside-hexuronide (GPH):cation symporter [Blautia sp.]